MMADVVDLLSTYELDNFNRNPFVPFNKLKALFTHNKVHELLRQHDVEYYLINETAIRIIDGGIRTFAVLAAIRDVRSITRFIREDQFSETPLDAKLPLKEADISRYFSNPDKGRLFLRRQWAFLAPVFSERTQSRRELDDRIILPFLQKKLIAEGGFAKVYRVTIDASHHKLSGMAISGNTQQQCVSTLPLDLICKELERPDDEGTLAEEFDHEVKILSALRCLQHPNIISLITAFSKDTIHSFLFSAADGDLKKLLNTNYRLPGFRTETEIFGSLWGLSSALDAVHNYFFSQLNVRQIGCHYDIKPNNILFSDGRLLLSDFGLSRLRRAEDGSQTTFKAAEGSYTAPECESFLEGFKRGKIGRASDVWSLGCVFTEILAYFSVEPANGPTAVQKFTEDRRLKIESCVSYMFFGKSEINPGVQRFFEQCKANRALSDGLKLLARIVNIILQFDPAQRPSAADITRLLFHLTQRTRIAAITSIFGLPFEPLDLELDIERERLRIWSETVGLNADPLDVPDPIWFGVNHSSEEYENLQQVLIKIETEIGMIATELQKKRCSRPPFRLYYRLQKLQDQLWDGQPLLVRRHMFDRLEEIMISKENFAQSREALGSIYSAYENSYSSSSEWFCRRFAYLRTMKSVASSLMRQDCQMHNLRVDRESIIGPWFDLGPHAVGTFEPKCERVLIEYLNYGEAWNSRETELLERVNAIASLRSKGVIESIFPILQCCGYYHEPARTRFGIVYQLPTEAQNTVPMNLLTVFEKSKSKTRQPSLTQRFKLASTLVSHVLSFHRGGWLHRSICALNVICFPDAFPSIAASFTRPYFIGFNHSRVNDDDEFSSPSGPEMEYQHPSYRGNTQAYADDTRNAIVRFRQEFDYYSVGMVLMEIALWKSLNSMTEKMEGSPEQMLEELRKKYVPLIKIYMGDVYDVAVQYCLEIDEMRHHSLEKIRNDFNENVVLSISRCLV